MIRGALARRCVGLSRTAGLRFCAPSPSAGCPFSGTQTAQGGDTPRCPMAEEEEELAASKEMSAYTIVHQLGKMRLSSFVTSTASCAYVLCGGTSPLVFCVLTAGTQLQSLSANGANQCIEIENDRMMKRTHKRPLVVGAITRPQAAMLSALQVSTGTAMLYMVSPAAAALGVANWFMYVGVYTPLKRLSTTNTWWGAIVGAVPPIMGGVAATGGALSVAGLSAPALAPAYLLGGLLFLWQIPHFMSLAFHCRRDYEKAGFKMLPFSNPTRASTYSVALSVAMAAVTGPGLWVAQMPVDLWFFPVSAGLNAVMVYKAVMFHKDPVRHCRSCFVFSYMYLAFMLAALAMNHFMPLAHGVHLVTGSDSLLPPRSQAQVQAQPQGQAQA